MAIEFWPGDTGMPGMMLKRMIMGGIHPTLMIRNTSKEIEFSAQVK
jgi:hypothetical protein